MSVRLPLLALVALLAPLAFVACGSDGSDSGRSPFSDGEAFTIVDDSFAQESMQEADFALEVPAAFDESVEEAFAAPATSVAGETVAAASAGGVPGEPPRSPNAAQAVDRMVIHNGNVSVSVEDVPVAVDQVRAIAESSGGFVEQLSRTGEGPDQFATITIRVPRAQFFTILDRIGALGEVRDEFVSSDDVTEQFIDLEARLRSATHEEARLVELLDSAETVADLLVIERELGRVRAEIERLQGQINYLGNRVALSTITVSLFPPDTPFVEPPSGYLHVAVDDVQRALSSVRTLVGTTGGVVDRVILSVAGDDTHAQAHLRVPRAAFDATLAALEREGDVESKEIQVSGEPPSDAVPPAEPDARIDLTLFDSRSSQGDGFDAWLVIAPIGGVLILVLAGALGVMLLRRRG